VSDILQRAAPYAIGIAVLAAWELLVRIGEVPHYVLPAPTLVLATLWQDGPSLLAALWVTMKIALGALAVAVILGVGLAVLMAQSRWIERSLFPYAVILQVTPIVAIAPLIIIYVKNDDLALMICALVVAFFPILSNTVAGLRSVDANLRDLFRLHAASRTALIRYLLWPSALPYFLAGLRISGGLSLIGAVVAEFVAGTGGTEGGLAFRILEAGFRLQIPRMFAALLLLGLAGVAIHVAFAALARRLLSRWHDSGAAGQ